jgi:ketosteroid isomerase-like protein
VNVKGFIAVLLILGLSLTGSALARTSDADVHRILSLEDRWAAGLPKRDGALFQKLMAPGFIYTENDHMMGRDELFRELTRGSDRVSSARNEGMRVHPFGDTAVVTGWLIVRGHGAGGAFNRKYRFTDVWMRRQGDWQIVAAHDYIAP